MGFFIIGKYKKKLFVVLVLYFGIRMFISDPDQDPTIRTWGFSKTGSRSVQNNRIRIRNSDIYHEFYYDSISVYSSDSDVHTWSGSGSYHSDPRIFNKLDPDLSKITESGFATLIFIMNFITIRFRYTLRIRMFILDHTIRTRGLSKTGSRSVQNTRIRIRNTDIHHDI